MPDIQDQADERGIALDRVGITGLSHPVTLRDSEGRKSVATATVRVFVALPARARAVHMSRFLDVMARHSRPLSAESLERLLLDLRSEHRAESAGIEIAFTHFVPKRAPVTGSESLMACEVLLAATLGPSFRLSTRVRVPVMTVCPCSAQGAPGTGLAQRAYVTVAVRSRAEVKIDDLVRLVEDCASAPVHPFLKAADERVVIEQALARPLFVEDVVRNVVARLEADGTVSGYEVETENIESAHDHNAFAQISRDIER